MKYKKALKYHLYSAKQAIFFMFIVTITLVGILLLVNFINNNSNKGILNSYNMETSYMVFLFVWGIASYETNFKFLLANGVSRKTQLLSVISVTVIISILFTAFNTIMGWFLPMVAAYSSLFDMLYPASSGIISYIWIFGMFLLALNLGYLIGILYYRMKKITRILVMAFLPVSFFMLLPFLDHIFFNDKILIKLSHFIVRLMGTETSNPYIGVLSMAGLLIFILFLVYLLNRRAVIEE